MRGQAAHQELVGEKIRKKFFAASFPNSYTSATPHLSPVTTPKTVPCSSTSLTSAQCKLLKISRSERVSSVRYLPCSWEERYEPSR